MFGYCTGLKRVTILIGLKVIANGTFSNCTALEVVVLPISVTSVGSKAFVSCVALVNIQFTGTSDEWGKVEIGDNNDSLTDADFEFAHTHTPAKAKQENIVVPTCILPGSCDEVVYCSECGEELSREVKVLNATGHTSGTVSMENVVSPTCTENGSYDETVYCAVCEEVISCMKVITARLGHEYVSGKCIRCNEPDPSAVPTYLQIGNYIYFGEYPKTIKADNVTIDLNSQDSRGYYLGSDGCYYAAVTADPFNENYTFTNNAAVVSGTVYYFKVQPIKWKILSKKNGEGPISWMR